MAAYTNEGKETQFQFCMSLSVSMSCRLANSVYVVPEIQRFSLTDINWLSELKLDFLSPDFSFKRWLFLGGYSTQS